MPKEFLSLLCSALILVLATIGCAQPEESETQALPPQTESAWKRYAPFKAFNLQSNPPQALVEKYDSEGFWVQLGHTPLEGTKLEASGYPHILRVSHPGYFSKTFTLTLNKNQNNPDLEVELMKDVYTQIEKRLELKIPTFP